MIKEKIMLNEAVTPIHRVCWSAIFAGAFVGIGLAFLLHLYGIAIGLSAFSTATDHGASVVAIGGLLGMLIGTIAAMGVSGYVAGYLGRFHFYPHNGGIMYGFITWSIVLFLSAIMIGPMEHYASAYKNSLSHTTVIAENNPVDNSMNTTAKKERVAVAPAAVVTAEQLAWGSWIMFGLFFIGAIASCIGASCGMQCRRDYPANYPHNNM